MNHTKKNTNLTSKT